MAASESMPVLPGYQFRRKIGGGGMGEVFEAEDLALARVVAIKRLRSDRLDPGLPGWGAWNARFRREARLLAAISHRNIAAVHHIVEHGGVLHLVMEHVDGHSLRDVLRAGPLDVQTTLEIAKQLATGLLAAHEAGVIHRDIKPDNIRINTRSEVKILDFGLAREHEPEDPLRTWVPSGAEHTLFTRPGAFMGTAGYASPEQVMGEPVDPRTDIFSFGCVVFECLAGQRPYDGRGRHGAAVVFEDEPSWYLLPAETPASLVALLRSCLTVARTDRPGDCAEVLAAIEALLGGGGGGAYAATPPSSSGRRVPSNLLPARTSFVGRESESLHLSRLLAASRLVTVVGLGGAGKTRLALRVAETSAAAGRLSIGEAGAAGANLDGVYLATVSAGAGARPIAMGLAQAMGIAVERQASPLEKVCEHIGGRRMLLVLDGCEHATEGVRKVATAVIDACPAAIVLAAGREPLELLGEQVFPLGPMELGEAMDRKSRGSSMPGGSRGGATVSEASRLFIERARSELGTGTISADQQRVIDELCRRVGGLPLAIEVAAALLSVLSLEELADRVGRDLGTVAEQSGSRGAASLASVIEWSCSRLDAATRRTLGTLAIFEGDFGLDAAEAVCSATESADGGAAAPPRVLGQLAELVRRSLLVRLAPAPGTTASRYVLLDPVREAVSGGGGETDGAAARAHLEFYCAKIEAWSGELDGPKQAERMTDIARERVQAVAALQRVGGDLRTRLRLATAMARYWYKAGLAAEGRVRLEHAIAAAEGNETAASDDPLGARAKNFLGVLCWTLGDRRAAAVCYREATAEAERIGDRHQAASILTNLGLVLSEDGDLRGAREAHKRAVEVCDAIGDDKRRHHALLNLAAVEITLGDHASATDCLHTCVAYFRAAGDDTRVGMALMNLGDIAYRGGDDAGATGWYRQAWPIVTRIGHRPSQTHALEVLGLICERQGLVREAGALLTLADELRASAGIRSAPFLGEDVAKAKSRVNTSGVSTVHIGELGVSAAGMAERLIEALSARFSART